MYLVSQSVWTWEGEGDVNLTDWGKHDGSSWLKTVWNRKPTYRSEALIYVDAHGEEISMYGKALLLLLPLPRSQSAGVRLSLKSGCCEILSRASAANILQKLLFIQIPSRRSVWGWGVWGRALAAHVAHTWSMHIHKTYFIMFSFLETIRPAHCTSQLLWMLFHIPA